MNKRQKNKLRKNSIIIVDIKSIPRELDLRTFTETSRQGFLVWDSSLEGEEPKVYPIKNKKLFKFTDKRK